MGVPKYLIGRSDAFLNFTASEINPQRTNPSWAIPFNLGQKLPLWYESCFGLKVGDLVLIVRIPASLSKRSGSKARLTISGIYLGSIMEYFFPCFRYDAHKRRRGFPVIVLTLFLFPSKACAA